MEKSLRFFYFPTILIGKIGFFRIFLLPTNFFSNVFTYSFREKTGVELNKKRPFQQVAGRAVKNLDMYGDKFLFLTP
ncbi:MAG: hypothetical protein DWQ02_19420 [Bacteroidetes bacterium]|nr:MAG: hypothetical protein DWQ02_19420 [Bacteroidota bacterium]